MNIHIQIHIHMHMHIHMHIHKDIHVYIYICTKKSPGCHIHMTSPIPFPSFSCLVAVRMCLWTEWFYVGDLVADTVSSAFVLDVEAFCDRIAGHLAFQIWHFRLGPLGSKHGVHIYICMYITYYI